MARALPDVHSALEKRGEEELVPANTKSYPDASSFRGRAAEPGIQRWIVAITCARWHITVCFLCDFAGIGLHFRNPRLWIPGSAARPLNDGLLGYFIHTSKSSLTIAPV